MRSGAGLILAATLSLALGLRSWGLGWGMPYAFHPDEENYLPGAVGMLLKGDLNPHYFNNPPFLTYTVLVELLIYLRLGELFGVLHSAADVGHQLLVSPTPLYLLARANSAILGTATVLATFLIARRLLGTGAGLAGAFLLSVAFLHVRDSHYVVNDVPATFWLMVSFYFATRVFRPGTAELRPPRPDKMEPAHPRDYLLAGAFLGLAVATKYNTGLGAVAILAAHLLSLRGSVRPRGVWVHLPLAGAAVASLLAFVLANPFSVLDFSTFLHDFSEQYGWASDPYNTSDLTNALVILRALSTGTSPLLLGASALGLGIMAARKPGEAMLVLSFPAVYLAFFTFGSSLFYARFALPLIPFIALLAGYAAVQGAQLLARSGRPRWAVAAAVALLALQPLALDLKHDSLLRAEDTRLLLGRWIEANVPPNSKLAVEGYSFVDSRGRRTGPQKLEYSLAQLPSLRANPLERYLQGEFNYLVASSYVYGRYLLDPVAHAETVEFYRWIDQTLPLVAQFSPTGDGRELPFIMDDEMTPIWTVLERERPGPTLKVYLAGEPPRHGVTWLETPVPERLAPGQRLAIPAVVQNAGNIPWPSDGYTPVRIGYRWLKAGGRETEGVDLHSPLPRQVEPGDRVAVQLELVAPSAPGEYTLQLDMVQENFAWFSRHGGQTRDFQVAVK